MARLICGYNLCFGVCGHPLLSGTFKKKNALSCCGDLASLGPWDPGDAMLLWSPQERGDGVLLAGGTHGEHPRPRRHAVCGDGWEGGNVGHSTL